MKEIFSKNRNNLIFLTEIRSEYLKTKNSSIKKYYTNYYNYKKLEKIVNNYTQAENKSSCSNCLSEKNNISNISTNN